MIHLISGKGGVGKSSVAASLAWSLSLAGKKTLLVEFGERSYFRHVFHAEVGNQPVSLNSHLAVARWDGESSLREYLLYLLKVEKVVDLFFENKVMRTLVRAAPGLRELSLLGKLTSGPRRTGPSMPYDEIVVDAFATGHFRALWRAPIGLGDAIRFGPMGDQSRAIVQVLKDPALTRFYVVTMPEDLPVTEGLELARDIQGEMEQTPSLVLNRWLESPLTLEKLTAFQGHEFADYVSAVLQRQDQCMQEIERRGFSARRLPWVFSGNMAEKIRHLSNLWSANG